MSYIARKETKRKRVGFEADPSASSGGRVSKANVSESSRPAREQMVLDRTNRDRTTKIHKVERFDGKQWHCVHDERKKFKSKRRPKT